MHYRGELFLYVVVDSFPEEVSCEVKDEGSKSEAGKVEA